MCIDNTFTRLEMHCKCTFSRSVMNIWARCYASLHLFSNDMEQPTFTPRRIIPTAFPPAFVPIRDMLYACVCMFVCVFVYVCVRACARVRVYVYTNTFP